MVPGFLRNTEKDMRFKHSPNKSIQRRGRQTRTQNPMYDRTKSVPNLQGNRPVETDKVRWVEDLRNNLNNTSYLSFHNQRFPSPDKDGSPQRL